MPATSFASPTQRAVIEATEFMAKLTPTQQAVVTMTLASAFIMSCKKENRAKVAALFVETVAELVDLEEKSEARDVGR